MRHFETEVKIKFADLAATRRSLKKSGFHLLEDRILEDNILLDTPDRSLRKRRSVLRLRRYASRWILTFKDTPIADPLYKSRVELETEIEDPKIIQAVFEALG